MINNQDINGILVHIKNKVPALDWDFISKYHNGEKVAVMELRLFQVSTTKYLGRFTYNSKTGQLIKGKYGKSLLFQSDIDLVDALLEVLSFELQREKKATVSAFS